MVVKLKDMGLLNPEIREALAEQVRKHVEAQKYVDALTEKTRQSAELKVTEEDKKIYKLARLRAQLMAFTTPMIELFESRESFIAQLKSYSNDSIENAAKTLSNAAIDAFFDVVSNFKKEYGRGDYVPAPPLEDHKKPIIEW
jgi:hypothetical protein